jgi:hypothetical protein
MSDNVLPSFLKAAIIINVNVTTIDKNSINPIGYINVFSFNTNRSKKDNKLNINP